jgi:hypothetical protein
MSYHFRIFETKSFLGRLFVQSPRNLPVENLTGGCLYRQRRSSTEGGDIVVEHKGGVSSDDPAALAVAELNRGSIPIYRTLFTMDGTLAENASRLMHEGGHAILRLTYRFSKVDLQRNGIDPSGWGFHRTKEFSADVFGYLGTARDAASKLSITTANDRFMCMTGLRVRS